MGVAGRAATVCGLLALAVVPAFAQDDAREAKAQHDAITGGGAWHFRSVPCVDGTVQHVGPRLMSVGQRTFTAEDYRNSGVSVTIRLSKSIAWLSGGTPVSVAGVTHYQSTDDNDLMAAERPGDRVQVCLMEFPTPTYDANAKTYRCDPDRDPRGWTFRVYDYRRHAAYYGPSSQHGCGGA